MDTDPYTPSELSRTVAANVEQLREKRGLRGGGRAVAKKLGIGEATLERLVKAKASSRLDTIEKVAEQLGVQPWQLLVPDLNPDRLPALADSRARVPGLSGRQQALFDRIQELDDTELTGALALLGVKDPDKGFRNAS